MNTEINKGNKAVGSPIIEITGLRKSFDHKEILKGIDLNINKGEIISFIGASGGGKSTLLRCINLLEYFDNGDIRYKGISIKSDGYDINSYRRDVGMIFQRFNLFSNLNVLENLKVGQIKVLKRSDEEASKTALEMLEKVGLKDFAHARVNSLSGGQSQRVAIARSLCMNPEVLLLDEPTSALDPMMVKEVLNVIKDIAKFGITMVIVTHELNFAKGISDRIVFLENGIIGESGTSSEIFCNPKKESLKMFLNV